MQVILVCFGQHVTYNMILQAVPCILHSTVSIFVHLCDIFWPLSATVTQEVRTDTKVTSRLFVCLSAAPSSLLRTHKQ